MGNCSEGEVMGMVKYGFARKVVKAVEESSRKIQMLAPQTAVWVARRVRRVRLV